jgi:NAD(P)-dependent dehydrogenase (short-subunit alcohol dehydrogenase family)
MPKTVLITGAGSGFGRGAAIQLAQRGHKVIAAVLNDQQAADLTKAEPKLTVVKLDITVPEDVAKWTRGTRTSSSPTPPWARRGRSR